jgi:hypothetical protein
MPLKITIDTSEANNTETGDFLKKHNFLGSESAEIVFKSQADLTPPSQADVYKEMMQSVRYHGSIRYILFPLYITLTGVLVGTFYKDEYHIPHQLLLWAGLGSSVAWLFFEFSLSESLRLTWKEIDKIVGGDKIFSSIGSNAINPTAHRRKDVIFLARLTFYLIYFVGIIYWGRMMYACL